MRLPPVYCEAAGKLADLVVQVLGQQGRGLAAPAFEGDVLGGCQGKRTLRQLWQVVEVQGLPPFPAQRQAIISVPSNRQFCSSLQHLHQLFPCQTVGPLGISSDVEKSRRSCQSVFGSWRWLRPGLLSMGRFHS